MINKLRRYKAELLMSALIVDILASPLADAHPHVGIVLGLAVVALIVAFFTYTAPVRFIRTLLAPTVFIWTLARTLEGFGIWRLRSAQAASIAGLLISLTILLLMLYRFTLVGEATSGVLAEAFISYLLIALSFSQIYEIVDGISPHAFNQIIPFPRGSTLVYFSLITLSSVGYGEIVPVNPYLRLVAAFESIIGIFYIAVVVARLVAAYAATPLKRPHLSKVAQDASSTDHDVEEKR